MIFFFFFHYCLVGNSEKKKCSFRKCLCFLASKLPCSLFDRSFLLETWSHKTNICKPEWNIWSNYWNKLLWKTRQNNWERCVSHFQTDLIQTTGQGRDGVRNGHPFARLVDRNISRVLNRLVGLVKSEVCTSAEYGQFILTCLDNARPLNQFIFKSNKSYLGFDGREKPEYLKKNLSDTGRE